MLASSSRRLAWHRSGSVGTDLPGCAARAFSGHLWPMATCGHPACSNQSAQLFRERKAGFDTRRMFIHRTPPSAAMSSAPSLRSCCRSISTILPGMPAATWMEDAVARIDRTACVHPKRTGSFVPTPLLQWQPSFGRHASLCRSVADKRRCQGHHKRIDIAAVQGEVVGSDLTTSSLAPTPSRPRCRPHTPSHESGAQRE